MTDLLSNLKNEVGIFCLLKGTKTAAECLKIETKEVKKFLSRCDFDKTEFFSRLCGILETTIDDLGLEAVADNLAISQTLVSLITKDSPNRINIYQEYQKIVIDENTTNLDKETQFPIFPIQNKKNELKPQKELDLLGEGIKLKRTRPKSSKSVGSNPEKQPIKRPKNAEFNKSITPPQQNNPRDVSMPVLNPPIESQSTANTSPIHNEAMLNASQDDIVTNNPSQDQAMISNQNQVVNAIQNQMMNPAQIPNIFSLFHPTLLNKYGPFGYPQPPYPTNSSQGQNLMNYSAYNPNAIMALSSQLMAGTIPIQTPIQRPNSNTRNPHPNPHQTQATCTNLLLKYNIPYHTPPNGNILDPDYSYRPKPTN